MAATNGELEKRLWAAADQLWANTGLKPSEYTAPVLGLIFLKFADYRFTQAQAHLEKKSTGRRTVGKTDYQAMGVLYVPAEARFSKLLQLAAGDNIAKAITDAMKAIEAENTELKDILPKTYNRLDNPTLIELLKTLNSIPMDIEGDAFGKIYEYFLGNFTMKEGQKGGEFFTPTSIVKLIVGIIEPFHGRILDPACGSGGMFVQSARFVENHKKRAVDEIAIYGQEKTAETIRYCKMNLAVYGLSGDIRSANTYYEDPHSAPGKFDFVMANPPFNVSGVDKDRIKNETRRFPFGIPTPDNANYLWIQLFYSSLNDKGRAGFVMANSAADARGTELEIRKKLIDSQAVDVVVSIGPNFFYTVILPCTLWFLDKGKVKTDHKDNVLFIDGRHIYHQVDRAHRDFLPEQIEFLSNIVRLYRGEEIETEHNSEKLMKENFPKGKYGDVAGLCKVASIKDIESKGWSLNPGRYVEVKEQEDDGIDFYEKLEELNEELEKLNGDARKLEERIGENVATLLEESA
ncbi:MAG: class I SAM-dependent DNA methyltransferase [Sedimentisphaerales bacterium]|jgi:type I restriction enzyme M protein